MFEPEQEKRRVNIKPLLTLLSPLKRAPLRSACNSPHSVSYISYGINVENLF